MRFFLCALCLVGTVLCGSPAKAADGPPLQDGWYVEPGGNPSECFDYGDWITTKDTELYDKAHGKRQVARIGRGDQVIGLYGKTYVTPVEVEVVYPVKVDGSEGFTYEPTGFVQNLSFGDRFYLLTDQSEGFIRVWFNGGPDEVSIGAMLPPRSSSNVEEIRSCEKPSNQCWWRIDENQRKKRRFEWWVNVRLSDGTVGWTRDINFKMVSNPC